MKRNKFVLVMVLLSYVSGLSTPALGVAEPSLDTKKIFGASVDENVQPKKETQKINAQKTNVKLSEEIDLKTNNDKVVAKLATTDNPKLSQVSIVGKGRLVQTKEGKAVQVVWYGLAVKKGDKEKSVGLNEHLRSSIVSKSHVLPKDKVLIVSGDVDSMLRLAESLLREDVVATKADETKQNNGQDQKNNTALGNTNGSKGSGQLLNSAPTLPPVTKKEKAKKSSYTSTDGCEPVIDLPQNIVKMTSRKVDTKNGTITNQGSCQPTGETMPIQKDYKGCPAKVDLARGKAYQQYRQYWVSQGGQPQYVGGCLVDESKEVPLEKDYSLCSPELDLENNIVRKKYNLKFKNEDGVDVVVKSCTVDPENTVQIQKTDSGCGLRHDFINHTSHVQKMQFYESDGSRIFVSSCTDSDETLKHELDFKGCPTTRAQSGKLIPQAKRYVSRNGVRQNISECAPVEDIENQVHKTHQGCEKSFIFNVDGGEAHPTARYYVTWDGKQEEISGCLLDDQARALSLEYDVLDYKHNDEHRESTPTVQYFLQVENQKVLAEGPRLVEGLKRPYEFLENKTERAEKYYVGCRAHFEQYNMALYERPDKTMYKLKGEKLDPEIGEDECRRTMQPREGFFVGCSLSPQRWMANVHGGAYGPTPGMSAAAVQNHNGLIDLAIQTGCSGDGKLYQQIQNPSKDQLIINVKRQREVHTLPDGTIAYLGGWNNLGFYEGSFPPMHVNWE
ncbi:MAG: hypothetical protein KA477_00140 [Candidatus Levybacteria bacterium]|nr:hypothetical protein [Candidatus Levybacteria bacterium]